MTDPVKTALEEMEEKLTASSNALCTILPDWAEDPDGGNEALDAIEEIAKKGLALADAVLAHHHPRQLYNLAETSTGYRLCGHDAEYDGDAHFEGDDGLWYCKDKPGDRVCSSCSDESDGDLWAKWPCPTYQAAAAALGIKTGEDKPDGQ